MLICLCILNIRDWSVRVVQESKSRKNSKVNVQALISVRSLIHAIFIDTSLSQEDNKTKKKFFIFPFSTLNIFLYLRNLAEYLIFLIS